MIDYDKLKLAHELALKCKVTMRINVTIGEICTEEISLLENNMWYGMHIDNIIAKLSDLTKPKLCKCGNSLGPARSVCDDCIDRAVNSCPSRETIIDNQLEYWTNLKIETISHSTMCKKCGMQRVMHGICWNTDCDYRECQHESEGIPYAIQLPETKGYMCNKCKKCGEFYK